ncbi:MAG: hypothetical protein SGILL_004718 [Bacillariaceae sp.]
MKIKGLISRFENKEFGNDPKSPSRKQDDQAGKESQDNDFRSSPARASSPGRLNIRNAIKNLRAPRSPGTLKNFQKLEIEEPEAPPLSVDDRVDDVLKSIVSRRSRVEDLKNSDEDASTNETEETSDGRREYLISEHSNRTLVVDNKKNKSQSSVLPESPWSSRNLVGSSRPEHVRKPSYTVKQKTEEQKKMQHKHEAEYGTLALKNEDDAIKEEPEEDLPPEVVAMEKKKLKEKSKSLPSPKKSRSMDDVLKRKQSSKREKNLSSGKISNSSNGENGESQRGRRRLSPGLLRRRGSNEKTEPKQKDITVHPAENGGVRAAPVRSLSAGNLRMARSKAKSIRERKARSQSPGDEKAGERKIRPGRKKSEKNIFATRETERDAAHEEDCVTASAYNENHGASGTSEQPLPPRRIRGRSPADDGKGSIRVETNDKSDDEEPLARPSLNRLPSRSQSPGTIRRSINMSGEVSRDVSLGALGRGRSPGALRKKSISGENVNQGALRGRSPGTLRQTIDEPGEVGRDVSPGALSRTTPSGIRAKSPYSPGARSGASERRSPGPFRRSSHSMRTRSPGALSTIKRKSSPIGAREIPVNPLPVATEGAEIVVEHQSQLQPKTDATVTEEPPTAATDGVQPDDDLAKKNLSVPRSKSPGALARRPSKSPRAQQTQKAQSLFEKKSPSAMAMTPRRRLSKDDGALLTDADTRMTLSSFDETEASRFKEYRPPDTLQGGDGEE